MSGGPQDGDRLADAVRAFHAAGGAAADGPALAAEVLRALAATGRPAELDEAASLLGTSAADLRQILLPALAAGVAQALALPVAAVRAVPPRPASDLLDRAAIAVGLAALAGAVPAPAAGGPERSVPPPADVTPPAAGDERRHPVAADWLAASLLARGVLPMDPRTGRRIGVAAIAREARLHRGILDRALDGRSWPSGELERRMLEAAGLVPGGLPREVLRDLGRS
jgi:hypothetical protein